MKTRLIFTLLVSVSFAACFPAQSTETGEGTAADQAVSVMKGPQAPFENIRADGLQDMIIAGGCFWCTESDFEKITGVRAAVSGYTGGTLDNPTYKKVGTNRTGHYEAVKVTYDPSVITYRELIDHYWRTIDPTDSRGQFCDKGESYRSAIFVTAQQRLDAEKSFDWIKETKPFKADIVTQILPAVTFYDAEAYHQDYYKRNNLRYKYYRNGCGRDKRLKQLWGGK